MFALDIHLYKSGFNHIKRLLINHVLWTTQVNMISVCRKMVPRVSRSSVFAPLLYTLPFLAWGAATLARLLRREHNNAHTNLPPQQSPIPSITLGQLLLLS